LLQRRLGIIKKKLELAAAISLGRKAAAAPLKGTILSEADLFVSLAFMGKQVADVQSRR